MKSYEQATREHIQHVIDNMNEVTQNLQERAKNHDKSKLEPPEINDYQESAESLVNPEPYGTEAYEQTRQTISPALEHHYRVNSHHPEHYEGGVMDMTLLDMLEMLCDWKAASLRHEDNTFANSM